VVSIKWRGKALEASFAPLRRRGPVIGNSGEETAPKAGIISTPLALGKTGLDHHRQAGLHPTHRRSMKFPGPGNPKLFPRDGLGIGAGGGIPSAGGCRAH
jgi:hypothetical protein